MTCRRIVCAIIVCAAACVVHGPDVAQAQVMDTAVTVHRNQLVRVAKWSVLTASAGAAVYGFLTSGRADDGYEDLEALCEADRSNCLRRSNGAYEDAELERRYQDVIRLDGRARSSLVASQVGVAATVILFIYDLRHAGPPRGIPYEPRSRSLQVVPSHDGGVQLRVSLPAGSRD